VTGAWLDDGEVLGCAYPREEAALAALAQQGISVLVNLHEQAHGPSRLAPYGLRELHLPVVDFTAPSPEQLEQGVATIVQARAAGQRVAVHCGGGLGRTGTLLACYLVQQGMEAEAAVDRVRAVRPGSVETAEQVTAVCAYAERRRGSAAR
jgi:atypical dual specificity phosphatase